MVKNESRVLAETLKSFLPHCDCLIAYDTGSTDNTIDILKEQASNFKKPLFLISGQFIDFSTSRNVLLKYANDLADYLVLPDSNDILRNGEHIRLMVNDNDRRSEDNKWNAVFVTQLWETTFTANMNADYLSTLDEETAKKMRQQKRQRPFKNIRIIKTNQGWTYNCVIHENVYLTPNVLYEGLSIPENPNRPTITYNTNIIFYQDRDEDNLKSEKRYASDLVLLHKEHENNPDDLRTIFYLGQTNECMKNVEEALVWYVKRADLGPASEEKYLASYRAGKLFYVIKKSPDSCVRYLNLANSISVELFGEPRAEPLVLLTQHYIGRNMLHQAYYYLREACKLDLPINTNLMVEKEFYDELRWTIVVQIGLKVGEFYDARYACKKLAENIGCKINGDKILCSNESTHLVKVKSSELQGIIDICNKEIQGHEIIGTIKKNYEKEFEKHKSYMVLPACAMVQMNAFKQAVSSGKVKNVAEVSHDGTMVPVNNNTSEQKTNKKKKKNKNKK